jgi:biopolymer transport protein ExbD
MELKMTPMIDVVFLLLIFFLWTSSFEQPEFDLPSALAEPPAGLSEDQPSDAPPPAIDELVVTIAGDPAAPRLALNGNPLASVEVLADRLAEVVALGAQPPVIVDPLPEMPMDVVIEVYDLARGVGLDRVLFAADP